MKAEQIREGMRVRVSNAIYPAWNGMTGVVVAVDQGKGYSTIVFVLPDPDSPVKPPVRAKLGFLPEELEALEGDRRAT